MHQTDALQSRLHRRQLQLRHLQLRLRLQPPPCRLLFVQANTIIMTASIMTLSTISVDGEVTACVARALERTLPLAQAQLDAIGQGIDAKEVQILVIIWAQMLLRVMLLLAIFVGFQPAAATVKDTQNMIVIWHTVQVVFGTTLLTSVLESTQL